MEYRNLIWDFDGTLFDTYPIMAQALYDTLRESGYAVEYDDVYARMKVAISETVQHYQQKFGFPDELKERYRARRVERELQLVQPFEGAREVLEQAKLAGCRQFICTHRGESIHELLRRAKVDAYFCEVTTSSYGFRRKPDPQAVAYLLEKYDLKPSETLMIGDRPLDVLAGQNAGTDGCFFDPDGAVFPEANLQIRRLTELLPLLPVRNS